MVYSSCLTIQFFFPSVDTAINAMSIANADNYFLTKSSDEVGNDIMQKSKWQKWLSAELFIEVTFYPHIKKPFEEPSSCE